MRVTIPAIDVDAETIDLGLDADNALEVPQDFSQTGWWTIGAAPGERGPTVIAGHIDSRDGPAVFYELRDLEPGDEVTIAGAHGAAVTYRIDHIEQVSKDDFPTVRVFGPTDAPALRLITCGGAFDDSTGHYIDNIVAYGSLVPAGRPV